MTIDLRDYSKTAAQRGWGLGWPSCAGAAGKVVTVTTARTGVRVSVHTRIARLVQMLMDETERRGYLLRKGVTGAFCCRAIAGTKVPSNHSWALAVDANWDVNPYVQPRRTDMPPWMPLLWNRYGFAWGGNYSNNGTTGKADSMHYEFMGTPADADAMTALALLELGTRASTPVTPAAAHDPEEPVITFDWPAGAGAHKIVCPVGKASQLVSDAWLSLACDGVISHFDLWFQTDAGGIAEDHGTVAKDQRKNWKIPDGTTQITVHYVATGSVGACLELKPR